eukprot:11573963-Karenia_brevis.AAC.1
MKSKELESEDVEIRIPEEVIQKARGSSSSQKTSAAASCWTEEKIGVMILMTITREQESMWQMM